MTRVLAGILEAKRAEIARLRASPRTTAVDVGPRRGLVVSKLLRRSSDPLRLITEIKRRSPSAGALSTVLSVSARALAYAHGGASMISVLCDTSFFDGSFAHVGETRKVLDAEGLDTPILAKEFVLDEVQLDEAAARGADAMLLIARIVDRVRLRVLVEHARSLGLEPFVEVVSEDELSAAIDAGAKVIRVNARDLDTLGMDAARTARVLAAIPNDRIAVHLSGLKVPDDVAAVARTRVDAALMGEALMRLDDPTALLRSMIASANG